MFSLQPPRHISTLPLATVGPKKAACRDGPNRVFLQCRKTKSPFAPAPMRDVTDLPIEE
jgi:hypothetical protein